MKHLADEPVRQCGSVLDNVKAAEALALAGELAFKEDAADWFQLVHDLLHPDYCLDVSKLGPDDIRRYIRLGMAFERLSKREIGK